MLGLVEGSYTSIIMSFLMVWCWTGLIGWILAMSLKRLASTDKIWGSSFGFVESMLKGPLVLMIAIMYGSSAEFATREKKSKIRSSATQEV